MSGVRRSRWAAIGAAVAVALGAGGLGYATASQGAESSFVSVTPARVLDTRSGLGLSGPLTSPTPRVLQLTGSIARPDGSSAVVVPDGATAVVLNVTAAVPQADGFISVRPDGTSGAPETSSLNFSAGAVIPNAVTVSLPESGAIELTYDAYGAQGPTTDVLVDVTGFYVAASGGGGDTGPAGPQGETGPPGPKGDPGVEPARVLWVATGGDDTFPSLSAALASITDNSASTPYVVKIAPGVYTETAPVAMKDFVDVEGSGQKVTTVTCACGGAGAGGFVTAEDITAEIRHLSIENTGGGSRSAAVATSDVGDGTVSLLHVTASASGGSSYNWAVHNDGSSPSLDNVTATSTGGSFSYSVYNQSSSAPAMRDVTAIASDGDANIGVVNLGPSAPSMTNVTAIGEGGSTNRGVLNSTSSPSMDNVTAIGTGGSESTGVRNINAGTSPSIRDSHLEGGTNSIYHSGGSSARVADTLLDGSVVNGGGLTCVNTYNVNFSALSCPP